jgi:hypothetical protein
MQNHLAANTTAPLPAVTIRVGVVGHRPNRLGDQVLQPLQAQLAHLLQEIKHIAESLPVLHASQLPPNLLLMSSLAEGTDSMAAEAALNLGYRLEVPLPFYHPRRFPHSVVCSKKHRRCST